MQAGPDCSRRPLRCSSASDAQAERGMPDFHALPASSASPPLGEISHKDGADAAGLDSKLGELRHDEIAPDKGDDSCCETTPAYLGMVPRRRRIDTIRFSAAGRMVCCVPRLAALKICPEERSRPYRAATTGPRPTRPLRWTVRTATTKCFLAPTASATANGSPSIRTGKRYGSAMPCMLPPVSTLLPVPERARRRLTEGRTTPTGRWDPRSI